MEIEDRVTVATPEGVDLDLVVAGLGSRFIASLVDSLLQLVLIIPFTMAVLVRPEDAPAIYGIGLFLVGLGYPVVFDAFLGGRTPGRRVAGLRLVTTEGATVGVVPAFVRNIVRVVDFLPGAYSIGAIAVLASPRNQRLGDMAAGTLVVRADPMRRRATTAVPGAGRAVAPDPATVPVDFLPDGWARWDLTRVSAEDVRVVRSFLARRASLDPAARARVGGELARRLRPAVVGPGDDLADEELLEAVLAAKTARG